MRAVQGLTGHGGWPMSVFLTPTGEPFYAGTYFPAEERHGSPSFRRVLRGVAEVWREQRDEVTASAARITESIASLERLHPSERLEPEAVTGEAAELVLGRAWDRVHGGFGAAPKFPQAMTITWLLTRFDRTGDDAALAAAAQALDHMARGGINDLLAGGFARYSTDARWLVPHFEKMLYDNALLLPAYALAAVRTGDATFRRTAEETAAFLLGTFADERGVFAAAFDADTDGVEGRTYVWSDAELREVVASVGEDSGRFVRFLGVTSGGNWEHTNVLHEPVPRERFARARAARP
jgi:uncharacterized protein